MKSDSSFMQFIILILRNKKKLLFNMLIVGIVAVVTSLLMPKWYKANALIMVPESKNLSGLSEIMKDFPVTFGFESSTNSDKLITYLYSRQTLDSLINVFDLMKVFDYEYRYKLRRFLREQVIHNSINDDGSIDISVIYPKDPQKPAQMANFLVAKIDAINKKLQAQNAHYQRVFLESQYNKIRNELKVLEDSMAVFQQKYGVLDITEQMKGTIELISGLQLEKIKTELALNMLESQYNKRFEKVRQLREKVKLMKQKIDELQYNPSVHSGIIKSIKAAPELSLIYFRLFRDIQIKEKILEFLIPQLEQAKVSEVKNTPSVLVIDRAIPAEYKYKPKRAVIVILSVMLALTLHILYLLFIAYLTRREAEDQHFADRMDEIKKMMRWK